MYRGKFKMFNTQKGFGFIFAPEFPGNIFTHTKSIWLSPGEFPCEGDECTFDVGSDRLGRSVANNVRITRRAEPAEPQRYQPRDERPYVQRPGERRQYSTRQLRAEQPVEFEPSALRRDRDRHRDLRTRRDRGAAERERIWSHPGADGLYV
jgi:cold shock CspA family protein